MKFEINSFIHKCLVLVIFVTIFVGLCVYTRGITKERYEKNYQKIYKDQINSIVLKAYNSSSISYITLVNGKEYSIRLDGPKIRPRKIHLQFSNLVESGDSITKKANSNNLILFHGNKKYTYDFIDHLP